MSTKWPHTSGNAVFEGHDAKTGAVKWTATSADLIFGPNSRLRSVAELYPCQDSEAKFLNDFAAAWRKVMDLDRLEFF